MFVGVIQDDPVFDSTSGTVTFQLVAKAQAQLEAADASEVGTPITDGTTSPASGNGVITSFSTQKKSLWRGDNIRVNGVVKTQGTHYTLDNLNDAEAEATIEFDASAVPGSFAILFDGDQWYRDKSISDLVGFLCDEAGIASGDREIEEPVFTGVDQSHTWATGANWLLWSLTNMDAYSRDGWLVMGEKVRGRGFDSSDDLDFWTAGGTGSRQISTTGAYDGDGYLLWAPTTSPTIYTLRVQLVPTGAGSTITVDYSTSTSIWTLGEITAGADGPYQIVFSAMNGGTPYYTQTSVDTISGNGTKVSFYYRFSNPIGFPENPPKTQFSLDKVRAITETASAESDEVDMLAAPTQWLPMELTYNLNGGTLTIKTKVSTTSGAGYDAAVAIDGDQIPTSALKRYAKVTFTLTCNADQTDGPEIDLTTLNWRGSSLFVRSADFTGLNCLQAVQELAKLGGMEFGSKGDGTFYFRNKSVSGSADLTISQKTVIAAVTSYSPGYRDVKNKAQVRYGKSGTEGYYFSEYAAADASEASPTTAQRFGERVIALDLQRLIFANDAQVADAVAQKLYELNYRPKRKLKLRCRIIPQLDLSDKVSISFHDSPLIEKAIFGDPLQNWPVTGANSRTIARDILMKVIGHSPDILKAESVLDLEEVLS